MTSSDSRAYLVVPAAHAERAIRTIQSSIGDRHVTCRSCGYAGPLARWGFKTKPLEGTADAVAISLCCPSCEGVVRVDLVAVDSDDADDS